MPYGPSRVDTRTSVAWTERGERRVSVGDIRPYSVVVENTATKGSYRFPFWGDPAYDSKDIGAPFTMLAYRDMLSFRPESEPWFNPGFNLSGVNWRGNLIPQYNSTGDFKSPLRVEPISDASLRISGTSAIARVLPTAPTAGLSTLVGETIQAVPRLIGSSLKESTSILRGLGGEHLNLQFGWLPLVSDVRSIAKSVKNSHAIIRQYARDSDQKIRRRYVYPMVENTQTFVTSSLRLTSNLAVTGGPSPSATITRNSFTKVWFSGAFRYHLNLGPSFWERAALHEQYANRLLGTRLTPEVLWELAPWSWLVDWFTNVGDVVKNISYLGSDGLVMQYGYAMGHTSNSCVLTAAPPTSASYLRVPVRTTVSESKRRIAANPYGFGIDDVSLSAMQLSILAALGLTRGRRSAFDG
jgi:hypothetical protein